jgi:mRNA interferase YafQ
MLHIIRLKEFEKDLKRCAKRGKNIEKFIIVTDLLKLEKPLPQKYNDHKLIGNFVGHRECHIEPDWLLIYKKTDTAIILTRIGSHSDLF